MAIYTHVNRELSYNTIFFSLQQHGSVYWKKGASQTLGNLQPNGTLHEQLKVFHASLKQLWILLADYTPDLFNHKFMWCTQIYVNSLAMRSRSGLKKIVWSRLNKIVALRYKKNSYQLYHNFCILHILTIIILVHYRVASALKILLFGWIPVPASSARN